MDPFCKVTKWIVPVALEGICTCFGTPFFFSMCGLNAEMCDMRIPKGRVVVLFEGSDIRFGGGGGGMVGAKGGGTWVLVAV